MIVIQHEPGEGPGALTPFLRGARLVRPFAGDGVPRDADALVVLGGGDRKSTRLNSSHSSISYAVFCLKKKNNRDEHLRVATKAAQQEPVRYVARGAGGFC